MGTVKRKRSAPQGKAKGRATTEELPADALLTDSDAINQISGLLGSRPWDSEAVEQIAALIRETGRDVAYRETVRETPEDEIETYDDAENEGWLYSDEDRDEEPAQLVASAYARISRIAGADGDPPRCPSCAGVTEWTAVGSRIHCFFCGYEGPADEATGARSRAGDSPLPYRCPWCGHTRRRAPSDLRELGIPRCPDCDEEMILTDGEGKFEPLAMRYDSGFGTVDYTCDKCGTKAESKEKPAGWTESGDSHRCPACAAGGGSLLPSDAPSGIAFHGMAAERLAALKADFTAWSGGFEPAEMTDEEISTFIDAALDTSFDRDEAVEALRAWRMVGSMSPH